MALAKGSFCRRREKNRHDLYFWTICGRKTGADFSTKAEDNCRVLYDAQQLASKVGNRPEELEKLAEQLGRKEVVIATETGCGVVPIDAAEREAREAAGRLSILLAKRAQKVIRVWCGLPESLR